MALVLRNNFSHSFFWIPEQAEKWSKKVQQTELVISTDTMGTVSLFMGKKGKLDAYRDMQQRGEKWLPC